MKKYIGMNFGEWCLIDPDDTRIMDMTLHTPEGVYNLRSDQYATDPVIDMLAQSTIRGIKLLHDIWFLDLII